MSSDPTTKGLIEAARESRTPCAIRHAPGRCSHCDIHALADRLEEVEEEREKEWCQVFETATGRHPAGLADALRMAPDLDSLRNDGPHGDDRSRCPAVLFEDGPRCWFARNHQGAHHYVIRSYNFGMTLTPEPTDPEPEDDPWEAVERWAAQGGFTPAALLDLRDRVEAERRASLERLKHVGRKWGEVRDRLTTLEGHADRGNEAERELRRRQVALIDDLRVLTERVERLEAALRGEGRPHVPTFTPPIGENT